MLVAGFFVCKKISDESILFYEKSTIFAIETNH